MIQLSPFSERLRTVFTPSPRGVVGLVDDLLELGREHGLRLDFHDGYCSVRPLDAVTQDAIDVPLQKSVFRAVLARVAALCNERVPNSVTPYGGCGELSVGSNPAKLLRVSFVNTATEQQLNVSYLGVCWDDIRQFTVLLRDNRIVTVRGNILKYVGDSSNSADNESCDIFYRIKEVEALVASFRVREVTGVLVQREPESRLIEDCKVEGDFPSIRSRRRLAKS